MNKLWIELQNLSINESIEDKGILKACFMAGTPGAGKTYTISKVKSGQIEPRMVNTDKWTEFIAQQFGMTPNDIAKDWRAYQAKIKSLSVNQLALYINSLLPLWIDGTSSKPQSVFRRQGILKSIGYDTAIIWVDTNIETAIKRNAQRERSVPEDFLRDVYKRIRKLKDYYRNEFRFFYEVNNDEGELNNDAVLQAFRKVSGFFNSPLENPIGKQLIDDMREQGHKYLADTEDYNIKVLQRLVKGWYR